MHHEWAAVGCQSKGKLGMSLLLVAFKVGAISFSNCQQFVSRLLHHSTTTLKNRRVPVTPLKVALLLSAVAVRELPEMVVQVLRLLE